MTTFAKLLETIYNHLVEEVRYIISLSQKIIFNVGGFSLLVFQGKGQHLDCKALEPGKGNGHPYHPQSLSSHQAGPGRTQGDNTVEWGTTARFFWFCFFLLLSYGDNYLQVHFSAILA